jgi:hypothetical protein
MLAYEGVGVQILIFLTSALVGVELSASRLGRFIPWKERRCAHWIEDWEGPLSGLDSAKRRQFLSLLQLELRSFHRTARSQSLYQLRCPLGRFFAFHWRNTLDVLHDFHNEDASDNHLGGIICKFSVSCMERVLYPASPFL